MLHEVSFRNPSSDQSALHLVSYHDDRRHFYLSRAGQEPDPLAVTKESGHGGTWSVIGSGRMNHAIRISRFKLVRLDASVQGLNMLEKVMHHFAGSEWVDPFIEHFPVPGIHDEWVGFPGTRLQHSGGGVAFPALHAREPGKWQKMPYWVSNGLDPGFMFLLPAEEEDEIRVLECPREIQ